AAVAAGFGAVFGTPLAGAVFALEFFVIGKTRYEAIFPAFISAILADFITKSWQVKHTLYAIVSIPEVSIETIIYSIVGGIIFGLCAALFSKLISFSSRLFKSKITYAPF
ncbi:MAG: chloride channel protein, partial [Flammeovirgaceae bacterium]